MAGFDDLIEQAAPYLARHEMEQAAGSDWEWTYVINDDAGAPIDWTSGYTFACEIRDKIGGNLLASPTVTGAADGSLKHTLSNSNTASLVSGNTTYARYVFESEVTRTSDGKIVKLVGCGDSVVIVKGQVTA